MLGYSHLLPYLFQSESSKFIGLNAMPEHSFAMWFVAVESDSTEEQFTAVSHQVDAVSVLIDQIVQLLSAIYQKRQTMPEPARSALDTLQNRLREEVFPVFSEYKVNRHCTQQEVIEVGFTIMLIKI